MRRSLLAAVLIALLAAPAAEARNRCKFRGTATIAENDRVRVYSRYGGIDSDSRDYACRKATGRRWLLAESAGGSGSDVTDVRLAGPVIGYRLHSYLKADVLPDQVAVLDVRRRKRAGPLTLASRGEFALTRAGTLVWTGSYYRSAADSGYTIRAVRAGQRAQTLDKGPGIEPDSLAVGAARAFWLHDGQPRTAAVR